MKHIYAVETEAELAKLQGFVRPMLPELDAYIAYLQREYQVTSLPRCILWTNEETATKLLSGIPLPAYTNEYRTVMAPDPGVWRGVYLRQLDHLDGPDAALDRIRTYYTKALSEHNILQILGHEMAHHSRLFLDDFDSYGSEIWFEEGMVEYISRKYFLTEGEFAEEADINRLLVDLHKGKYGNHPLEDFGLSTYEGDYANIFFEYWRSFLAVNQIVAAHHGDVQAVFREYHKWAEEGRKTTLTQWFHVEISCITCR